MKNDIDFYYYSGTGNTLLAVREMAGVFSSRGIHTRLHRIETNDPASIATERIIGLGFPVAFQSASPFLWKFFKALPPARQTPIFMIDTMGMFSGAIVGPLKHLLTKKGYHCIGAQEIVMPNNWFPKKIDAEANKNIIDRGLAKARAYADAIAGGTSAWPRVPLLPEIFYYLCNNPFMLRTFNLAPGKSITLDRQRCTRCGLCARLCPVGNIDMQDYPRFLGRCEVCLRCLCFCPRDALAIPGKPFARYRAVEGQDLLGESVQQP